MSGWLSTHVLDTAQGCPAAGMMLTLWKLNIAEPLQENAASLKADIRDSSLTYRSLKTVITNLDGRTDIPLLEGEDFQVGNYEITFEVGDYFAKTDLNLPLVNPFLSVVPLRFGIGDATAHYHVPLLVSPWSYSTYRGS